MILNKENINTILNNISVESNIDGNYFYWFLGECYFLGGYYNKFILDWEDTRIPATNKIVEKIKITNNQTDTKKEAIK